MLLEKEIVLSKRRDLDPFPDENTPDVSLVSIPGRNQLKLSTWNRNSTGLEIETTPKIRLQWDILLLSFQSVNGLDKFAIYLVEARQHNISKEMNQGILVGKLLSIVNCLIKYDELLDVFKLLL